MSEETPKRTVDLGVPEDAIKRLAESTGPAHGALFTSDLTVNEFLLVREAGSARSASCSARASTTSGSRSRRWGQNMELDALSQAMYHARELAMTRMEAEADALGADGIVGVRLEIEFKEFGNDLAEFIAVGTAVIADEPGGTGETTGQAVHLRPLRSGLLDAHPGGLRAARHGDGQLRVPHRPPAALRAELSNIGRNVEIPQYTEALYDARELAMSRMQAEAEDAARPRASSVCSCSRSPHRWGGHTTEFFAIGTAVRPLRADHTSPRRSSSCPSPTDVAASSRRGRDKVALVAAALRAEDPADM